MNNFSKLITMLVLVVFTTACQRNISGSTYTSSNTAGIVYEGVILSARQVTVKDSDKLGSSPGLGTLGGGLAGGIGGSQIGKGKGSALGAVGGAVAGAVLGSVIEDQLGTQQGMEYVVKLSQDYVDSGSNTKTENRNYGGSSVSQKLRNSTSTNLKSNVISVVQATDQVFSVGQKVYVIFNDDRPRVIPYM